MQVKPVRETVLQALHCWRSIERKNVPECSDTMSTIKGMVDLEPQHLGLLSFSVLITPWDCRDCYFLSHILSIDHAFITFTIMLTAYVGSIK